METSRKSLGDVLEEEMDPSVFPVSVETQHTINTGGGVFASPAGLSGPAAAARTGATRGNEADCSVAIFFLLVPSEKTSFAQIRKM